jgi:hypothetical protein
MKAVFYVLKIPSPRVEGKACMETVLLVTTCVLPERKRKGPLTCLGRHLWRPRVGGGRFCDACSRGGP